MLTPVSVEDVTRTTNSFKIKKILGYIKNRSALEKKCSLVLSELLVNVVNSPLRKDYSLIS